MNQSRLLFTGRGTSGSWTIRGEQLGHALGANVIPDARHLGRFDLAVLVKRGTPDLLSYLRGAKLPVVWDVVDSWPQPLGNTWDRDTCMRWMRAQIKQIRPIALVAATQAMAADCAEFGRPVLTLPHHARPGQRVNPIRARVRTVGYQGGPQYLGSWASVLDEACRARGWRFVINPVSLAELDIVVAVREPHGYAPRTWKSGVKAANAQGSGTPCILNREQGCIETASGAECWADTPEEMAAAFDSLIEQETRQRIAGQLLLAAPKLEDIAKVYAAWLNERLSS